MLSREYLLKAYSSTVGLNDVRVPDEWLVLVTVSAAASLSQILSSLSINFCSEVRGSMLELTYCSGALIILATFPPDGQDTCIVFIFTRWRCMCKKITFLASNN